MMMPIVRPLLGMSLCAAGVVLAGPRVGVAQVAPYAKEGFYVGVSAPYVSMGLDFDGQTVFVGPSDVVLVPEVDSAFGLGVSLGMRSAAVAFDLNYLKSDHKATFAGATGDVEYQQFGFDVRLLHTGQQAEPYFLFGFFFPQLVLKDGSATAGGSIGDASYRGIGGDLGVGLLYHLHPRFAVDVGVLYRLALFGSVKGAAGSREELDEGLFSGGPGITIGGTFTF